MLTTQKKNLRQPKRHLPQKVNKKLVYNSRFKAIAGCMSDEDARQLKEIIEKGCEQIDHASW